MYIGTKESKLTKMLSVWMLSMSGPVDIEQLNNRIIEQLNNRIIEQLNNWTIEQLNNWTIE